MLLSGAWPKSKAALFEFSEVRQGFTIINNHMDPGRALRFCTGEGLWLLVLRSSAAGMRHAKARRFASFSANRIYQWTWGGTRRLRGKSVLGFVLRWGWPGVLDKVRDIFWPWDVPCVRCCLLLGRRGWVWVDAMREGNMRECVVVPTELHVAF